MSCWERLQKDSSDRILIPMNVDGGIREANFFNSFKVFMLMVMGFGSFGFLAYIFDGHVGWILNTLAVIFTLIVDIYILRFCIFEEAYQSKMYKKMKQYEVTTADVFWNIANLRETDFGTSIVYSDLKVGVLIKLERDTVIGKPKEFKIDHYDALSEFYKELNIRDLNYIQINLMESTGKDPRLNQLEEVVKQASFNPNLAKMIEAQLGYLKTITRVTLFESDYILIYTEQPSRADYIVQEAMECCEKLSGSAFIDFRILNKSEIIDLMRDLYDIKYFDYQQAVLKIFGNEADKTADAFDIIGLEFRNGEVKELTAPEKARLARVQELLDEGTIKKNDWNIREALEGQVKVQNPRTKSTLQQHTDENTEPEHFTDIDSLIGGGITEKEIISDTPRVSVPPKFNKQSVDLAKPKQDTIPQPVAVDDDEDEEIDF